MLSRKGVAGRLTREAEEGEESLKMRILVTFCLSVVNAMNCCKGLYDDESKVLGFI